MAAFVWKPRRSLGPCVHRTRGQLLSRVRQGFCQVSGLRPAAELLGCQLLSGGHCVLCSQGLPAGHPARSNGPRFVGDAREPVNRDLTSKSADLPGPALGSEPRVCQSVRLSRHPPEGTFEGTSQHGRDHTGDQSYSGNHVTE